MRLNVLCILIVHWPFEISLTQWLGSWPLGPTSRRPGPVEPPPSQAPRPGGAAMPSPPAPSGWPGWAGPGRAGQGWAARLEVRAGSKGWCPRPQPEGPRHHDGGSQAPKQGGEQPPALWAPGPGARADGGGRGGSRYPGASRERGGGGGERGERQAPGVPGRTEGAPRRPPRALRAAGGAGAKREAQEEVPEEAEEVWQGRHSTAPSALGRASRRLPESWSPIPTAWHSQPLCPALRPFCSRARHRPPAPRHSFLEPRNGSVNWAVGRKWLRRGIELNERFPCAQFPGFPHAGGWITFPRVDYQVVLVLGVSSHSPV